MFQDLGRVYVNGDPGSPNSCLIQQQGASYAGTSPIFGAAIYHNAESYGLGQPYSKSPYSNAIDPYSPINSFLHTK